MSLQNTFRDVAKPKTKSYSATIVGGVLELDEATSLEFAGDAVGSITSLSGHEYLVDGQPIFINNLHPTNTLTFTIGAFSTTVPAGYGDLFVFDEAGTSFKKFDAAPFKTVRDDIVANTTAISQEASDRAADTALNYRLDGSRALTGNMDVANNFLNNVPSASNGDQAVNFGQMQTAVATLEAAISASATSLEWRTGVLVISKFTAGNIPANGDALVDSNFGAGNVRLFEDDEAGEQFTVADFPVNEKAIFLKDATEPKIMVCRDVLGTKRWYDASEADVALKNDRAAAAGDTFIVKNDLLDTPDAHENTAIYHILAGAPKTALKIGDLDWDQATGINISVAYTRGLGGETVVPGDSVEQSVQKLDGNIEKNKIDASAALVAAVAQERSDTTADIATAIAQERSDTTADITASQSTQDLKLASSSPSEGASLVGIEDSAAVISSTTVEGALFENRTKIDVNEADISALQSDVSSNTTNIGNNASDIAQNSADIAQHAADMVSTEAGKGASLVGVEDAAGKFAGTTVEEVVAEIDTKVNNLNLVNHRRGLHEAAATGATALDLTTDFADVLSGGVVQDLSTATYLNCFINRDGAMLIGGVGYVIAGTTLTFTATGGGELIAGEVVEVKIVEID